MVGSFCGLQRVVVGAESRPASDLPAASLPYTATRFLCLVRYRLALRAQSPNRPVAVPV
jgi:hypothetical protein